MSDANEPLAANTAQFHSDLLPSRLRWIPQAASASAVLAGCLVLIGWWFDVGIFKSPLPGFPAMKANTALAFVLIGVSLWLSRAVSTNALSRRLAQVCASIVVLIGLLALSEYLYEYLSGEDLGIDRLLLQERGMPVPHANSGRMAFASALNLILLGGALLLLDVKTSRGHQPAEDLAVAVAMSALLSLTAYLYGEATIDQAYPFVTGTPFVAILTATLAVGILLARSQHRIVSSMASDTAAAAAMRRLMLLSIVLPGFLGWVRLVGQRRFSLYGTEFGLALMVVFATIALSASIYWQATSLIRAEEYQRGINEMSGVLGRSLQLAEIYPTFAEAVKVVLPYHRISVVAREGESLVAALSVAEPPLQPYQGRVWRCSADTAVEWVMTHKIPRLVRDLAREQTFADEAVVAREGVRATLMLPLIAGGETVGVFVVDSRTPGAYSEGHEELVGLIAEQLALAIQNASLYARVARHATELQQQVEERTQQLQEATRRAEDASRHKSAFLANMSHELRTPLNAILGFADLLRDQMSGPLTEKQARYANHIQTSGRHLLALINDLLDLSKVEAGKLTLRPEPFNLSEALAAAVYEIHPLADAKRLTLTLDADTAPATLIADPIRFKQILHNLLSNAIKFSPEDGRVAVTARCASSVERRALSVDPQSLHAPPSTLHPEDLVEIAVTDTGIGIAAEQLSKLFQRFTQLETVTTKQFQGTGLGLALTKQLVELHGGTIEAASLGEGHGSTFTVCLPLPPQASPEN